MRTFRWTVVSDNGQVIPESTQQTLAFTPVDNGLYTARLTATDDDGASSTDEAVITVSNVAPGARSLHPDGKTVVAGFAPETFSEGVRRHALARYDADGTPDTTFGDRRVCRYAVRDERVRRRHVRRVPCRRRADCPVPGIRSRIGARL